MFLNPCRRVIGSIMLVFLSSISIPEPGVNGSLASISRITPLFSAINLLMNIVR